jgi:hypothetical protein
LATPGLAAVPTRGLAHQGPLHATSITSAHCQQHIRRRRGTARRSAPHLIEPARKRTPRTCVPLAVGARCCVGNQSKPAQGSSSLAIATLGTKHHHAFVLSSPFHPLSPSPSLPLPLLFQTLRSSQAETLRPPNPSDLRRPPPLVLTQARATRSTRGRHPARGSCVPSLPPARANQTSLPGSIPVESMLTSSPDATATVSSLCHLVSSI